MTTMKRSGNQGGCPAWGEKKALLFNHLSKVGGTFGKILLRQATGADEDNKKANVTYINQGSHVPRDSKKIGPLGALIVQEDTDHKLQTTEDDANNFFVIGSVRRPCDYMLSQWAWMSKANDGEDKDGLDRWGKHEPYDSPEDHDRFYNWANKSLAHRDKGDDYEHGSYVMSSHMDQRFDGVELPHCWVRTHKLVEDARFCMEQFEQCGGYYNRTGLSDAAVAEATQLAIAAEPMTSVASCDTFYSDSLKGEVLQTDQWLIDWFGLDSCCSAASQQ